MSVKRQITWDYRIPLVTNKYILLDSAKALGIAGGFLLVLLLLMSGGEYLDQVFVLAGGVTGFMVVLYVLVMIVIFGNGYNATFTVGDDGISYDSGKKESGLSKGAVAVSALTGSWKSLGPALLGASQLSGEFHWNHINSVHVDEGRRVITIIDDWHVQLRIYCTPETYATCLAIVEDHISKKNIRRD
ncbi:MAG: hypothetical protein NTV61_10155 [Candidatus Bathyarchaeota archaeon]|nr:hypothetical protein [Candidatus Bathyarchaeota archaeon]